MKRSPIAGNIAESIDILLGLFIESVEFERTASLLVEDKALFEAGKTLRTCAHTMRANSNIPDGHPAYNMLLFLSAFMVFSSAPRFSGPREHLVHAYENALCAEATSILIPIVTGLLALHTNIGGEVMEDIATKINTDPRLKSIIKEMERQKAEATSPLVVPSDDSIN